MMRREVRRGTALLVGGLSMALLAGACGSGGMGADADRDPVKCARYERWGGNEGKTVSVYTSIRDAEGKLQEKSYDTFEECTGIEIKYEGSGGFEDQLPTRVQAGDAPDLAYVPQPGLLRSMVETGQVKVAPPEVSALVDRNFDSAWREYGTVDGRFYAAPLSASVKSYVWYSPKEFKDKGYSVPETWDELIALSDRIVPDHKPWCAGIESGRATGWVVTDWLEDVMLRDAGPAMYDKWVEHEIPFNSPEVVAAAERVATILKNPAYVNGGFGGVKTITTTAFQEGGLPILERSCSLHRQASFYANQWGDEAEVAEDGDVFAFYFPPIDPTKGKPVIAGGDFVAAFADRPEVRAFQEYLATVEWANERAKLGNWINANKGLDIENVKNPIDKLSVEILQDPDAIVRFDASDLMPREVGAGSFWTGMTDWMNGKPTKETLDYIERTWPSG